MPDFLAATAAPGAGEVDASGLAMDGGERCDANVENAAAGRGAKARKRRGEKKQRSKKVEDCAADDEASTTGGVTKHESVGAGSDESNDLRAASPPSETNTVVTEPLPQFQFGRALPQLPTAVFVEVPVLAHYELCELPSADDADDNQGLFATQVIQRGTRVISERPILTLTAPGDHLHELMLAYHNLSKIQQERVWNLRPAAPEASEQLQNLRFLTDRLAIDLKNIILKPEAARTQQERSVLDEMVPKLERAMNVWRVAARWHANRCAMTDLPVNQRGNLPTGTPITGLFVERAHIRHSCVPNCFASYDANRGRMNVHVTRDIAAGDELTLSAFADTMYYANASDRAQELAAWGLACTCEACDAQHPAFAVHETARQRAHARVVLLNDMLTQLEKEHMEEVNINTAQDILLALIRDLKASGCESVEAVRWRNVLVDRILPARALVVPHSEKLVAWQVILMHARECERMGLICYGEDREEFRVLRQTREETEAVICMMEEAVGNEAAAGDFPDEQ